jgi:hypothetical protein
MEVASSDAEFVRHGTSDAVTDARAALITALTGAGGGR